MLCVQNIGTECPITYLDFVPDGSFKSQESLGSYDLKKFDQEKLIVTSKEFDGKPLVDFQVGSFKPCFGSQG